jgi:hypothetical protein
MMEVSKMHSCAADVTYSMIIFHHTHVSMREQIIQF